MNFDWVKIFSGSSYISINLKTYQIRKNVKMCSCLAPNYQIKSVKCFSFWLIPQWNIANIKHIFINKLFFSFLKYIRRFSYSYFLNLLIFPKFWNISGLWWAISYWELISGSHCWLCLRIALHFSNQNLWGWDTDSNGH